LYHKNQFSSGTIKENISYGLDPSKFDDSTLDEACRMANAYDFIHDKDLFPKVTTLWSEKEESNFLEVRNNVSPLREPLFANLKFFF
jgi:hypothetical protein